MLHFTYNIVFLFFVFPNLVMSVTFILKTHFSSLYLRSLYIGFSNSKYASFIVNCFQTMFLFLPVKNFIYYASWCIVLNKHVIMLGNFYFLPHFLVFLQTCDLPAINLKQFFVYIISFIGICLTIF